MKFVSSGPKPGNTKVSYQSMFSSDNVDSRFTRHRKSVRYDMPYSCKIILTHYLKSGKFYHLRITRKTSKRKIKLTKSITGHCKTVIQIPPKFFQY